MKNPEWGPNYRAELARLGWPRARALEILSATGKTKTAHNETKRFADQRTAIERDAKTNLQKRLAHPEAA